MDKESYFYLLWKSLWTSCSAITGGIGLLLALISWIWKPDHKFPIVPCVIIAVIAIFLFQVFVRLSVFLYENRRQTCTVFAIMKPYGNFKSEGTLIALTSYMDYFTEGGVVSLFHLKDDFERQIAVGRVLNIQENKKVQILLSNIDSDFPCEKLLENDKDLLKKLRVKPIIKMSYLEEMHYGK